VVTYKGRRMPQASCKACVARRATERNRRVLEQRVRKDGGGVTCPVCGQIAFEISKRHAQMHGFRTAKELVAIHGGSVAGEQKREKSRAACEVQWRHGEHAINAKAAAHEMRKRWKTLGWREKMRLASAKRVDRVPYTTREGEVIRCLSLAEVFMAAILDHARVAYVYEPPALSVGGGAQYTPDFVCGGALLEVKAYVGRERLSVAERAAKLAGLRYVLCDFSTGLSKDIPLVRLSQFMYRDRPSAAEYRYADFAGMLSDPTRAASRHYAQVLRTTLAGLA